MQRLAASSEAKSTYVRTWLAFAYERELEDPRDACVVDELTTKMTDDGYQVLDLVFDLTATDSFRWRTREVTP
jgi:hypothetical protein